MGRPGGGTGEGVEVTHSGNHLLTSFLRPAPALLASLVLVPPAPAHVLPAAG